MDPEDEWEAELQLLSLLVAVGENFALLLALSLVQTEALGVLDREEVKQPLVETLAVPVSVLLGSAVPVEVLKDEAQKVEECEAVVQPLTLALEQAEATTDILADPLAVNDPLTVGLGERLRVAVSHTDTVSEEVLEKEGEEVAQPLLLGEGLPLTLAHCEDVAHIVGVALAHWVPDVLSDCVLLTHDVPCRETVGVRVPVALLVGPLLPDALCEPEGEDEALTVSVAVGLPVSVPLGAGLPEAVLHREDEGLVVIEPHTEGLCEPHAVPEAVRHAVWLPVPEEVALRDTSEGLEELLAVSGPLCVPDSDALTLGEALCDRLAVPHSLGDPVAQAVAEALREAATEALALWLLLPQPLIVPVAVELGLTVGQAEGVGELGAVGDPERDAPGEALGELVAVTGGEALRQPLGVPVRQPVALAQ